MPRVPSKLKLVAPSSVATPVSQLAPWGPDWLHLRTLPAKSFKLPMATPFMQYAKVTLASPPWQAEPS